MLNKSTSRSEYVIQSGVTQYPVGFEFLYNGDDTPQIRVTIGAMIAEENVHFVISEDLLTINLIPLEEEAPVDPNDYSWLEKWVGMSLVIERDIPFVQESDYQLGRISPERIEKDFDLTVMRDQVLDDKIRDARDEFAEADKSLSDKIDETKSELQKNIDDKLPLTGGTLTGPLTIVGYGDYTSDMLRFKDGNSGVVHRIVASSHGVQMPFELFGMHSITPSRFDGPHCLGDDYHRWDTVYTTKISNGSDILIPEKAGTMALLEDVEPKADKTELQNYLPLTGGTLTNLLSFDVPGTAGKNKGLIYVNTASGGVPLIGAKTDDDGVLRDVAVIPKLQTETFQGSQILSSFIGTTTSPVTRIHAKKIGTGLVSKLLTIPDGPGTIARLEDIPETYTKEELDAKFAEIPAPIDAYTKAEVDAKLSSVYKFKGSVANVNALPTGASVGDTYNVEDTGANYAWDGSKWDKLSDTIDLTGYATEEYVDDTAFALMDYIDDEVRPLKTDNKNLYNNQLVLRDMLNEKDENNEFIQLTTEAQTAIPAINELNEKKASKEDLAGYLPLSGGAMTGELRYDRSSENNSTFTIVSAKVMNGQFSIKVVFDGFYFSGGCTFADWLKPSNVAGTDLGDWLYKWRTVFTSKISNGLNMDIEVPTKGGTMALVEDIAAIGGDGAAGQVLTKTADGMAWQDASGDGGGLSDKLGFNTDAGYLYFKDISNVDDFENLDAFALTADVGNGLSIVNRYYGSLDQGELYRFSDDGFRAGEYTTGKKLGSDEVPWMTTYTAFISAGLGAGELQLPTEEGTIARIEDIDERIGDISTALAAILGE